MQAQTAARFVGAEGGTRGSVEDECGLEVGAGAGPLDEADALAQIEAPAEDGAALIVDGFRRCEQAAQAAAKIGGASQVGFGLNLAPRRAKTPGAAGIERRRSSEFSGRNSARWSNWKSGATARL